jgi:hypothetical protein
MTVGSNSLASPKAPKTAMSPLALGGFRIAVAPQADPVRPSP